MSSPQSILWHYNRFFVSDLSQGNARIDDDAEGDVIYIAKRLDEAGWEELSSRRDIENFETGNNLIVETDSRYAVTEVDSQFPNPFAVTNYQGFRTDSAPSWGGEFYDIPYDSMVEALKEAEDNKLEQNEPESQCDVVLSDAGDYTPPPAGMKRG